LPFVTKIKLSDGSSQVIKTEEELEITPEVGGMVRLVYMDKEPTQKQVLIRTDLVTAISVEVGKAEEAPQDES